MSLYTSTKNLNFNLNLQVFLGRGEGTHAQMLIVYYIHHVTAVHTILRALAKASMAIASLPGVLAAS